MANNDMLAASSAALGQALLAYFTQAANNKKFQANLDQQQSINDQDVALKESQLDPWRQSMFQMDDLSALDKIERASRTPAKVSLPSRYAAYAPQVSGGYAYAKSPELTSAAAKLKQTILAGQGKAAPVAKLSSGGATDGTGSGTGAAMLSLLASNAGLVKSAVSGAAKAARPAASAIGSNGVPLGGTTLAPESLPAASALQPNGVPYGGTVLPAEAAPSGNPFGFLGGGSPSSGPVDWRSILRMMQNGGGGADQYRMDNPFSAYNTTPWSGRTGQSR